MLREINNLVQSPGSRRRRWWEDEFFDLIIWFDDDGGIYGFQLCYDVYVNEHALTWKKDIGFYHNFINAGDEAYTMAKTPILSPDGLFPYQRVIDEYVGRYNDIEKNLFMFVYDKLLEYANLQENFHSEELKRRAIHQSVKMIWLGLDPPEKPVEDFIEVIVKNKDRSKWIATFYTFDSMTKMISEHKKDGKFLSGKYFWANNLVLIDKITRVSIENVVDDLMVSGEFEKVFDRLDW